MQFFAARHVLSRTHPDARITTSLGFAYSLWQKLSAQVPSGFRAFQAIVGRHALPAYDADLLVHISSDRADLSFQMARELLAGWSTSVVVEERTGFQYLDNRDLTGFQDGIENPQTPDERAAAALIQDGPFSGGSFAFAARFVHQLQNWQQLAVPDQEGVIGRTKLDGAELADEVKPATAHIARANIDIDVVRHSLPYGDAGGEQGLFFLQYANDLTSTDTMLQRMYGLAEDGLHDRLLDFTTAVGGGYFFAPAQDMLNSLFDIEDD